ncbi:unnamed protein product, partial [Didymodactylos carnosus]
IKIYSEIDFAPPLPPRYRGAPEINEALTSADPLKQIGAYKVNQPIANFVLNQKADPNLKNRSALEHQWRTSNTSIT